MKKVLKFVGRQAVGLAKVAGYAAGVVVIVEAWDWARPHVANKVYAKTMGGLLKADRFVDAPRPSGNDDLKEYWTEKAGASPLLPPDKSGYKAQRLYDAPPTTPVNADE